MVSPSRPRIRRIRPPWHKHRGHRCSLNMFRPICPESRSSRGWRGRNLWGQWKHAWWDQSGSTEIVGGHGQFIRFICYIMLLWCTMIYYDLLWLTMMYYELLWITMICYDLLWFTMMYYELLWFAMIYYDLLWYTMMYYDTFPDFSWHGYHVSSNQPKMHPTNGSPETFNQCRWTGPGHLPFWRCVDFWRAPARSRHRSEEAAAALAAGWTSFHGTVWKIRKSHAASLWFC